MNMNQNDTRTSHISLLVKILILTAIVCTLFVVLGITGYDIFGSNEKHAGALPENILLALLENYEQALLTGREDLVRDRDQYTEQLGMVTNRGERLQIESKIRELEEKIQEFDRMLTEVKAEKAKVKDGTGGLDSSLAEEKRQLQNELASVKFYWNQYTQTLETTILNKENNSTEQGKVRNSFDTDNGLQYVTGIINEYYDNAPAPATGDNSALSAALKKIETLSEQIKKLETDINGRDEAIADLETKIAVLLDHSDINGYFINKAGKTLMVINLKKEAAILSTGNFTVYDNSKTAVSKIYISRKEGKIEMTKLPGYSAPQPGNWF